MTTDWYGSDSSGMISGYLFEDRQAGRKIDSKTAQRWLECSATDSPDFIWLHFDLTNNATLRWLHDTLPISDRFYDAVRDPSRTTRLDNDGEALIGVVNDVVYDFLQGPTDVATLWIHVSPRAMVSVRHRPLRSIERLREAVKRAELFDSPTALLVHLLQDQADELASIVRDTAGKVDSVEDQLLNGRLSAHRSDLGAMRRLLVRLKRLLAPEPAALFRLLNRPPRWMRDEDSADLRQATEEFGIAIGDLDDLRERIKLLQEELANHVGEQTNRSVFVLTMVTVLALPINLIAGLMGMNVGGVPWAQNPHGFYIVGTLVATVTGLAAWIAVRRTRR